MYQGVARVVQWIFVNFPQGNERGTVHEMAGDVD